MADEQRQRLLGQVDDELDTIAASDIGSEQRKILGKDGKLNVQIAIAFLILGSGMLWPFNSFITANEFLGRMFQDDRLLLRLYSPSITFLFTITNLVSTIYFTMTIRHADLNFRVTSATLTTTALFVLLSILTVMKLAPRVYFGGLMLIVATTGVSTAALQNGCFGLVGAYHPRYVPFIMIGQGIAGVSPAILSIAVALIRSSSQESTSKRGFSYFLSSSLVLAASYFAHLSLSRRRDAPAPRVATDVEQRKLSDYGTLVKSYHSWTIFLVFFVTLTIFPSVTASVLSVLPTDLGVPFDELPRLLQPPVFVPLGFLLWNGGDLLARILTAIPALSFESPRALFIAALLRFLWIPAIFLCNVRGGGATIQSDVFFFAFMLLFGMSNGFLGSLTMAAAIKQAPPTIRRDVGAFMSFMLCSGLVAGSLLSFVF